MMSSIQSTDSMTYSGSEYFYLTNLQGDVTGLADAAGAAVVSYSYDSWGKLISTTGSLATTLGVKNPYRYRGYRYDTETGLYYLQSRYYNPEIGRFINADDAEVLDGGNDHLLENNLFTYCMNNLVNMTDDGGAWPSWVKKIVIGTAIIAGAALIVATAGTGTVLACFVAGALKGAAIGAATGAVGGGTLGALSHRLRKGTWTGAGKSALNGAADGYMWGAATGFITGGLTSRACFVAGTPVLTGASHVAIEDIRAGDFVWAEDPETGEKALKRVVQTFVNETTELVRITIDGEVVTSTPEHPFYVKNKVWTEANKLSNGDVLVSLTNSDINVKKVERFFTLQQVKVFNFEVQEFHTYLVGNKNILVHNLCNQKSGKIAGKITGYTKHGLNQAIGRDGGIGVKGSAILDAVRNPLKTVFQDEGKVKYVGKQAVVVLNKFGKIITTFAKSSKYRR